MNLEQLRKQAKELVKAARAGDPAALERLGGREPILARAQLVLAREQGYPSWAALVAAADASVETFVRAATTGRRLRAEQLLAARPELERDAWVGLVLGREWRGDAGTAGGPLGWAPLLYACHSCFDTTSLGRELLDRGADPNAFFVNEYGRMSALYGAAGVRHDPVLTRALLEAGANPDDGESLYHATEAESPECVAILLEHGAQTGGTNALAHALDNERLEHVRLLLDHGIDPNEGACLAHAVRRGRGAETIELLATHGADLDRPGGETWRGDVPLRTPYQHAVLRGKDDLAELLARLGASTDVDPADAWVAQLARGGGADRQGARLVRRGHAGGRDPDRAPRRPRAGGRDRSGSASAGWSEARRRGRSSTTPAGSDRSASSSSCSRSARIRQRRRRPTSRRRSTGPSTPRSTTGLRDRDYVGIAERLVAAGASPVVKYPEAAEGPLAEWLDAQSTSIASPNE